MKKYMGLIALGVVVLAGSMVVDTQAASMRTSVSANVPFDFYVANAKLSAGEYTISESNGGTALLLIQKKGGGDNAYVFSSAATPEKSGDNSKLVFNRYNDSYFLSKILAPGLEVGHDISPSRKERELEKESSLNSKDGSSPIQTVTVALK